MGEWPLNADARVEAVAADGAAEALLWWRQTPPLAGERVGVIGGFQATSEVAAGDVLRRAQGELRGQGCTVAIGPMDGSTWRRYRFVTDAGAEPPFFLEPTNPAAWPEWWRAAGFAPLAQYYSSMTSDLVTRDERLAGVSTRMAEAGVTIRPLDPSRLDEELERIHAVSVVAFRDNFLYTPLPRDAFAGQYQALQSMLRPEFVRLAERAGECVGYVFAIPDLAQRQRGECLDTLIVKTLAVMPGRAQAGLGAILLDAVQAAAQRLGFTRAIHALMHETNTSRNLSAHSAHPIRRYTLFSCRL